MSTGMLRLPSAALMLIALSGFGFPFSAAADDAISQNAFGEYDIEISKKRQATWVVTSCGDNAGHCITVTEFSRKDTQKVDPNWTANAYWSVGSWIMQPVEVTLECSDGSEYQVALRYSWDAAKNRGWRSFRDPGVCEDTKAKQRVNAFKLVEPIPLET